MTLASDRDPADEILWGALLTAVDEKEPRDSLDDYTRLEVMMALDILSDRTAVLLDRTNVLQADKEIADKALERYKKYFGFDDRSWVEKAWDSDATKVAIFIGGIWLGTRIVYNVN